MKTCRRLLACLLLISLAHAATTPAQPAGWDAVPAILARIKPPQFPNRDFPITDYGAIADGTTDATDAIKQAMAAATAAGGGRVVVAGGVFLTGAVHLKSNVNLHIAEGATLRFNSDPAKYLPVVRSRYEGIEVMNFSPPIYAFEQENIAVTGKGTLDGIGARSVARRPSVAPGAPPLLTTTDLNEMGEKGVPVEQRIFGDKGPIRTNFVVPYRCRNVLIEDIHIINSPMWALNPVLSTNITVRGVNITSHGSNNDGCNPDSCRDVLIENCLFDTGDDCVAIKSGKDADGRRVNVPSENIIVRNCVMKDGHAGVGLGSENSGGVRNVYVEDCRMDSPQFKRALRLKTNSERGGIIENVFFRNVEVGQVTDSILGIDLVYGRVFDGPRPPIVRNVRMENVTGAKAARVLSIVGAPTSVIENVRIVNSVFKGVEEPDLLVRSGIVTYENVSIEAAVKK